MDETKNSRPKRQEPQWWQEPISTLIIIGVGIIGTLFFLGGVLLVTYFTYRALKRKPREGEEFD
ncbi:MAG: hypothetical protein ABIH99_02620 [Candidatus Micrarchaeota archaeon]